MFGVLLGYTIILSVIGVGYILARTSVIGPGNERLVLNRVSFYAATPALLFTVLAQAPPAEIFTPVLAVAACAAIITASVYIAISALLFRRPVADTAVGAASASYVNSNNIGLPVGIYVLGTGAYVPPILVLQMVVFTPIILAALSSGSVLKSTAKALFSPIVLASISGLCVSVFGWQVPEVVMEPLTILGGASIPMILMSFGASLHTSSGVHVRGQALVASALKVAGMPVAAWLVAHLFGLDAEHTYAAVILAALPTAQNVYNYAATHRVGEEIARDSVLVTTFAALPAMLVISLLLGV